MAIRPGEQWGVPYDGRSAVVVNGDMAELAAVVAAKPGRPIAWNPTVEAPLARAVGLRPWASTEPAWNYELPMDVLLLSDGRIALNLIVLGTAPARLRRWTRSWSFDMLAASGTLSTAPAAKSVVIAIGQFWGELDLVPRGHPGDGRAEVHTYRLRGADRPKLRRRLRSGTHVPHPDIEQRSVKSYSVCCARPIALEIDGRAEGTVTELQVTVHHDAYRLLV